MIGFQLGNWTNISFNRLLKYGRRNSLRVLTACAVLIVVLSAAFPPDGAATIKPRPPLSSDRIAGLTPAPGRGEGVNGGVIATATTVVDEPRNGPAKTMAIETGPEAPKATDSADMTAAAAVQGNLSDQGAPDRSSVDMAAVQRIRMRASAAADLSGEYLINDGAISIPTIGRFSIRGLRLTDLEALISRRLTRSLHRDVQVSVEIERYLPFYVVGKVANSGEQEWRQGLTLIQALATSGGVIGGAGAGTGSDSVDSEHTRLRFALAQLERLKAERDGTAELKPSPLLMKLERAAAGGSSWSVSAFVAQQSKLLEQQQASVRTQIESLTRERNSANAEEEAGKKQVAAVEEQLTIAREIVKSSSKLHDKQLVANNQFLNQKMQSLAAEVSLSEARTAVGKVRTKIALLERQIAMIPQERKAVLNERIELLEREVAEIQVAVGGPDAVTSGPKGLSFAIARRTERGTSTATADLFTEISPGDVIIVSDAAIASLDKTEGEAAQSAGEADGAAAVLKRTQRYIESSRIPAPAGAARNREPQSKAGLR